MSGWDWLHAGLEVATYAQARQAQQNLAAMKTAADIEAGRKVLIEAMRNFIFDIARDIQLADENVKDHPQQVYIIAKSLEWRLKDSGLTPEVFPEFSDKDYVFKTQKKVSSVVSESSSQLDADQIEQSDTAIKYIVEMPSLQEAIKAKSSWEQIQATQNDWKGLEGEVNGKKIQRNLALLGLIGSPCLCLAISAANTKGSAGLILGGLLFIGALIMLVGGSQNNSKYTELKTNRENWQKNLLPANVWQHTLARFGGDLSSAEFQNILEERVAYLKPILGNEFQTFLTGGKQ